MENIPLVSGTFGLILMVVWLLLLIFTLVHTIGNKNIDRNNKILWIAIMLVVPILGSLIYLFWRLVKKVAN
ncbi:PLDc N-terminal domain-containing protein [Mucilaginibacter polytrichastri]|uniref:Cardiolipin synthase N-terminal domain-containing protein n=1 Tax=Mucilaginibacter polytrichastri TaxID=1302689 RepID=A0A1Q6A5N4_9SPHI|nr:PLDc N-terminal domain-containing protein [Mucilaginibacter polytrichastri]OKS89313.1 hypothetical protein RG47T_4797 [Mucilaginibacter polytrichastri]SFS74675.1 Phospholipase_D-nuclease N-terminal [Mucilaginibacter polytrichastri]